MSNLDSILSGASTAAPETETTHEEQQVTQVAEGESPQPETEATEQGAQGQKMVPHEALHAEKQKVKRYTEEVADFRRQLAETNSAWERRMAQLVEAVKPKQEPQAPPDWFADPDAAISERLGAAINPLSSTISGLQTQLIRLAAVQTHGAEKVRAFEEYVAEQMEKGDPEMAALGAQMRSAPDPMAVGLAWFEKRTFDPEKERERIRAEILAEVQKEQQPAQTRQPVMPSNLAGGRSVASRSGPAWSGPATLTDIFNRTPPSG